MVPQDTEVESKVRMQRLHRANCTCGHATPHVRCVAGCLQEAPTTEAEVFDIIFKYIDRIFAIVRPRKLLYMAIGKVGQWCACVLQVFRRAETLPNFGYAVCPTAILYSLY